MSKILKVCVTGHRPNKLFPENPYSAKNHKKLFEFWDDVWVRFQKRFPDADLEIRVGMALGVDTAAAEGAIIQGLKTIACVPFKGQERRWATEAQTRYQVILTLASGIELVSDKQPLNKAQAAAMLNQRNHHMVDNSDIVIAMWDGSAGGTGNCVRYAELQGKKVFNVWDLWRMKNE